MAQNPHVDDVGTRILVTITEDGSSIDVSAASTLEIHLEEPDGTVQVQVAAFDSDGTDGKIVYVTQPGDLSVAGDWKIQGKVGALAGWTGRSEVEAFRVDGNL